MRPAGASAKLGLALGVLLALLSLPHALAGWPPLGQVLDASGVVPDVRAGLAVGWVFGSVGLVVMGTVVALASFQLRESTLARHVTAVVGLGQLVFGLCALVYRDGNPHFAGFVAIGAALVAVALSARRR
jgi:hypothetical protein